MTSVGVFYEISGQFLEEMKVCFPEIKTTIESMETKLEVAKKANARGFVETFCHKMAPYTESVSKRDDQFFLENYQDIALLQDLPFEKLWTDDLEQKTKDAIWGYVNVLLTLSSTITALSSSDQGKQMLNAIESTADMCAQSMSKEGGGDIGGFMKNMGNPMSLISGLMTNMGAAFTGQGEQNEKNICNNIN